MSCAVTSTIPLPTSRRPSLLNRALTTPPTSPTNTTPSLTAHQSSASPRTGLPVLTPPTSPQLSRSSTDCSRTFQALGALTDERLPGLAFASHASCQEIASRPLTPQRIRPIDVIECPFDVEILKDYHGRDQRYGSGAWSSVYKATAFQRPDQPSPPTGSIPVLVAVKMPARRDAAPIIRSEGWILSELAVIEGSKEHIVPFYGMLSATQSIVLAALPLSLENHIRTCAESERKSTSSWDAPGPVVGNISTWLDLAERTISTLAWLHDDAGVVHGDIKPGNILLRPSYRGEGKLAYHPLFADFSSGQLLESDAVTPNTLSAITQEYTAPELLTSAVLKNPNSTATTSSDVFSLAVTLLVAVTGELLVYSGSVWQRQAMATQGWNVLSSVRNGAQGLRLPRHGTVDQVLERAVLRAGMGRIEAKAWKKLVIEKVMGEPGKRSTAQG